MPMRVKPLSYTAMAASEGLSGSVFRPRAYVPVSAPTPPPDQTSTTVGTKYFKPTEKVAAGIKKEFNLWQDIKNMGGTVIHKGGSLLMGALDLLSRPRYALMNVYKDKLERHYTAADSAGGADVTGGEAFKAFVGMLTPAGVIKDVVSGDFDDTVKAAVSGVTGKSKTNATDIMKVTNPEFLKAHPMASGIAGVGLDIALDPLTWLTMGLNPGSVGRAGVSGAKLAMGDKLAAQRLWNETLFTKTGRAAGTLTVKKHIQAKELKTLARKQRRTEKKIVKSVLDGKRTRLSEKALADKHKTIVDAIAIKRAEDLKGAELAWKVFKKSLPSAGIMTASRFNTGAGTATMNLGKTVLADLHADFNWGVAQDLSHEDRWKAMFAANKGRDFTYKAGGNTYTIQFSKDMTVKDFVFRVSQESNPIASFKTGSSKAARSRKGDIEAVESRAQAFRSAFFEHMDDSITKTLTKEESTEFGKVQGLQRAKAKEKETAPAAGDEAKDARLLTLKEEDFDDAAMTYEKLRDEAKAKWKAESGEKAAAFDEGKVHVIYEGADGPKKIKLSTLKTAAEEEELLRTTRLEDKRRLAERSPTQKSVDQLTGVSDNVATGRTRLIEAGNRARVAREMHAAGAEEGAAYQALHRSVAKSIDDSPEFTAAEKAKYHDILRDTSKPLEDRIAGILRERSISNSEANEILEDTFKVTVDSAGNIHIPKGGTLDDIPTIIRAVIKDRFEHRITGTELENAGTSLAYGPNGAVGVVQKAPAEGVVNYSRDINAELGMMVLDGYRAAARYAAETELFQQDPEALFNVIHKTTSEFMDMATADTKRQVIQIMYNMTGMRLPEKFVPAHTDVIKLIANKEHQFVNSLSGKPLPDQKIPWENLGVRMQTWVTDLFGFAPKNRASDVPRSGYKMEDIKAAIVAKADDYDKPAPASVLDEDLESYNVLLDKIEVLHDRVGEAPVNGTTGAVNRYSFIDFLLHSEQILKAQSITVHVADTSKGAFGRINAGRLSALDSFTFVDDETKAALEALSDLKEMSKGNDSAELRNLAQEALAAMFVDAGGERYIDNLTMPASGSLQDANFGEVFSTLGAHARLKESTLRSGKGIQTGHAVQLLDSMWGKVTVNHEMQKAFQNAILHRVVVKGMNEQAAAEDLVKVIDDFFAPFDNIKKILYPVRADTGARYATSTLQKARGTAKKDFGPNPIETKGGPASRDLAPEQYAPKSMLNKKAILEEPEVRSTPAKAGEIADPAVVHALESAKTRLKAAVLEAKKYPKLKDAPEAETELAAARDEYVQLLKASDNSRPVDPVEVAPGAQEAAATPEGTPRAPDTVDEIDNADPADFVNNADVDYTPDEIEAIRKWIGITNNMSNPEMVAQQVHAHSIALSMDLIVAQQKMISDMADLTLKYGANVRFMGIPFMPMFNPMNATHTMAGVVAFDQYMGSPNKFYLKVINKVRGWEKGEAIYRNSTRPSHYFEGSLEKVRQDVVNSVSELRKKVIYQLDEWYEAALATKFDSLPQVNGMKRRQKLNHFKQSLFKPRAAGVGDPINQYKLADGTNPVKVIADDFEDSASTVFKSTSGTSKLREDELSTFNRHVLEDFRLSGADLTAINLHAHANAEFAKMMPYSVEWLREVGKILQGTTSKLRTEKLLKANLGKLHYALQDAKMKYHSGAALNHGVFEQFAFKMDPATAAMYNNKAVKNAVGVNGEPMRGPVVAVKTETIGPGTVWEIEARHIPAEFLDKGYYMPTDILPEINTMFKYMDEMSKLNETITTGYLNKILAYFKQSVTIYKVPSYPIRNLIGDVFMSAFDGLVDPRYYKDAARLQMDFSKAMKEISTEEYTKVFDNNYLKKQTMMALHDPASVLGPSNLPKTPYMMHLVMQGETVDLNGSQIMEAYYKLGLGQNRVAGEIAENVKGARQGGLSKFGGKVHDLLRNTNDVREDWARLSHFLFALEREAPLGGGFEEVIRRAGNRVIKHHFDYSDVSLWERQSLAKWIPFYKWVRNIVPYTIATMVTKPVALKVESGVQSIIGHLIDDDEDDNRVDYIMPEWLEFDNPVSIGSYTDENNNEFGQYMSLAMPLSDTLKRTLGPAIQPLFDPQTEGAKNKALSSGGAAITTALSMTNPLVKGTIQAGTGMELWPTGGAPQGKDSNWAKTMGTAIPGVVNIDALLAGKKGLEGINGQNLLAFWADQLGAINMSNNSERSQLGELKQREDRYRVQLNKAKSNLANTIQKQYPNSTPDQRAELVDAILKESRKSPDSGRLGA
jgi:hypothetical protein